MSKVQQAFAVLPSQDMRIGTRTLNQVYFVTPVSVNGDLPRQETDGLLPTVLFQRLFISGRDHYVVLEPK